MKREKAMETVRDLPENFALEDLIESLVFVEKVEKGLAQVEEGKTLSHSGVKESIRNGRVV